MISSVSGELEAQRLLEARQRLHALQALDLLQRNWREILSVVYESPTTEEARQRIVSSFPVDAEQATIMLSVQVARVGEADRGRVATEIAKAQAQISELEVSSDPPTSG